MRSQSQCTMSLPRALGITIGSRKSLGFRRAGIMRQGGKGKVIVDQCLAFRLAGLTG